jgi:hypothetical protein
MSKPASTAIVLASALALAGCYGPESADYGGAPYYAPDYGPPGVVSDYGGGCWNCGYGGGGNRRPPPPPPGGPRYGGPGGPPPPGAGLPPRPPPGMPVRPIGPPPVAPPFNPVNQRNGQPLIPQAPPPIR